MLLRRLKSPLIVWGGVGVGFGVGITSTSTRTMATNAPLAALAMNADHSWVSCSCALPIHGQIGSTRVCVWIRVPLPRRDAVLLGPRKGHSPGGLGRRWDGGTFA